MNSAQEKIPRYGEGKALIYPFHGSQDRPARIIDIASQHAGELAYKSYRPGRTIVSVIYDPNAYQNNDSRLFEHFYRYSIEDAFSVDYTYNVGPGEFKTLGYWNSNPSYKGYGYSGIYGIRRQTDDRYEIWKRDWASSDSFVIHACELYTNRSTDIGDYGYDVDHYSGTSLIIIASQLFGKTIIKNVFSPTLRDPLQTGEDPKTSDARVSINFNERGELVSIT